MTPKEEVAMSEKCPKCGEKVGVVGHWLGPIHSHEPDDATCLRTQLAHANAESKRFMEQYFNAADCIAPACDHMNTWAREYGVVECKSPFSPLELRELAERLWLRVMEREDKLRSRLALAEAAVEAAREYRKTEDDYCADASPEDAVAYNAAKDQLDAALTALDAGGAK